MILNQMKSRSFSSINRGTLKHTDACEEFIAFLEEGTGFVQSEIYEKVSEITGGIFVKEFPEVCIATL